jgi:hypothetical protein
MDPELFKRMQEAAARFNSGESDFEEIITPIGPAHLVRDDSDPRGFRIDFVGGSAQHTVPVQEYPAAPSRPPGYPAPLPFVKNCAAIVSAVDQSVTWVDPEDPEEVFARLLGEMTEDGWSVAGWRDGQVLEKDGSERTLKLMLESGVTRLVLRERPAPPDGE